MPTIWAIYAAISDSRFVPSPAEVVAAVPEMIRSGELTRAAGQSLGVLVAALVLGTVCGLVLGWAMGRSELLYAVLDPYVAAIYTVPSIAVIPILVVILGWGSIAKIIIVGFLVFLPIVVHAATGIREASRELIEVAAVFCSGRLGLWRDVLIPSSLPALIPGFRIAAARALTGLVVAEFSTQLTGFGYVISRRAALFQISESLVPVLVLAVIGFALKGAIDRAERRLIPWALRK